MENIRNVVANRRFKRAEGVSGFNNFFPRRRKKNNRTFIDNEYLADGYAKLFKRHVTEVYLVLAKYANYETQICFPSYKTIMHETGIKNRNTISTAIQILKEYGIIVVGKKIKSRNNLYGLQDSSRWQSAKKILHPKLEPKYLKFHGIKRPP